VDDSISIAILSALVFLGGLGFHITAEILRKKRWSALRPNVRIIILAAIELNLFGFLAIWALEAGNPRSLSALEWTDQARAAWMQAVALRTAGFTTFDTTLMHDSTALLSMILMFIGGSMSTAGGIKLGTFVVIIAAVTAYMTQRRDVTLMKRSIPADTVQKALAVVVVTVTIATTGLMLLTLLEDFSFLSLMVEVIAALSTADLSLDLTQDLSPASQCVLMVLMFVGRIGPLTLVYGLSARSRNRSRIHYPEMEFQVG
jgi:trk system potassium uptake protein TrkH